MAVLGFGKDIYVAQSATGTQDGSSCSNAQVWNTTMNSSDVFHLCGTINGSGPGTSAFTMPSGSAGNPTTIIFEYGARLSQSYWSPSGAINIPSGHHDILIDGSPMATACGHTSTLSDTSCNGIIENTANGTAANSCDVSWPGYANHQPTAGIYFAGSNNSVEVRNVHVQNMYFNDGAHDCASDSAGRSSNGIEFASTCSPNCHVHNNEVNTASGCINHTWDGNGAIGYEVDHNYLHDCHWQVAWGVNSGSPTTTTFLLHDNEMTDWVNWECPALASFCTNGSADTYHTDGFILFGTPTSPVGVRPMVYNNYIHGDLGSGSATAFIFLTRGGTTGNPGAITGMIFNNILVASAPHGAAIWLGRDANYQTGVYNNTIRGFSHGGYGIANEASTNGGSANVYKNNTVDTFSRAYYIPDVNASSALNASDYNNFYNMNDATLSSEWFSVIGCRVFSGTGCTFGNWQQTFSFDPHSQTGNPNLSSTYQPKSGSVLISSGTNLTSLGITALNSDISGVARPSSGPWDIGAYQYSSQQGTTPPTAPTGLIAAVN